MKKLNILKVGVGLLLLTVMASCAKVETGYLSDNVRYGSNPIVAERGVFKIVTGIIPDASTPPYKITLVDVRNKETGQREESFFKDFDVTVWSKPYDPKTDTTLALIEAKRSVEKKAPLAILEKSGQLMFTQATDNVPLGEYEMDIQVQNPKGTKVYKGITVLRINDPIIYEHVNAPYFTAVKPQDGTGVRYPHDVDWFDASKEQSANITSKITRDPNGPNQIVLKVYDKNGKLFPGEALERRPDGNGFLNTMATFAYKTTVTDTAVIHDYAQARFPDVYWDSQTNNILCYYRIYDKWIESIDYVDTWNAPFDVTYKTDPTSYILQMRFGLKFNLPGRYIVELHLKAKMKDNVK